MKASDLFIKALENEGVEYIFGIPGLCSIGCNAHDDDYWAKTD